MPDNNELERTLWAAADKMRSNMDAAEYKHIVLGLIFLKYISDAFNDLYQKLKEGKGEFEGADPEDADEYLAHNLFFVSEKARWQYLQDRAKQPEIGRLIDDAMDAIERTNPPLKGVLPKIYADPELNKQRLGELIDLIGTIGFNQDGHKAKDLLGRVYEYFLGQFADAEGKKGGQFWTPSSIVKLLVEMLEPYNGRVYDGCSGSGGMFVQSEKFVLNHQGNIKDLSIFGQESNPTTLRLARMNLAIRGIDAKLELGDTFLNDRHPDLKADFILVNPPFNVMEMTTKNSPTSCPYKISNIAYPAKTSFTVDIDGWGSTSDEPAVHPNIGILLGRMDDALSKGDYSGVLHASASIFETMAKDVVGSSNVQHQSLGGFFDSYRKHSHLPQEILDYIQDIYKLRNTAPLAGHGSTQAPNIDRKTAITLAEMTKAFVTIEYKSHQK